MSFEAKLLTVLIKMHAINAEDALALEKAFHDSGVDQFDDFLLSEGIIDEENLLEALSQCYQVPSFDVVGYFFERHYVRMFPKDMLLRNRIIPLDVDENSMVVVASQPDNPELLSEIGANVSYDIQFYVGIGRDICDAVEEFYDKSDTQDAADEDIHEDLNEEHMLAGEFQFLEENGEESISFSLDNEEEDLE